MVDDQSVSSTFPDAIRLVGLDAAAKRFLVLSRVWVQPVKIAVVIVGPAINSR